MTMSNTVCFFCVIFVVFLVENMKASKENPLPFSQESTLKGTKKGNFDRIG